MNSRGALISHRISGETLPISDSVAMTPTIQPATAGTQRYREFAWLPERRVATVTDREDITLTRENPGEMRRVMRSNQPGLPNRCNARQTAVRSSKCWKKLHGC